MPDEIGCILIEVSERNRRKRIAVRVTRGIKGPDWEPSDFTQTKGPFVLISEGDLIDESTTKLENESTPLIVEAKYLPRLIEALKEVQDRLDI